MQLPGLQLDLKMELGDKTHTELLGIKPTVIPPPFYLANQLEQQGKVDEAQKIYREMLNDDFDNCVVTAALGMNYAVAGQHGLANILLGKALKAYDDRFEKDLLTCGVVTKGSPKEKAAFLNIKKSEIMNAIGTTWKHENKCDKARYWFEKAQAQLPGPNADIQNNLATLHINEGSPAKAMAHLNHALEIDPKHAQAHWNRSLAKLELGDYASGFEEYGWGKRAEVRNSRNYSTSELPEWDGTPGKTVVVYGEQGIGDEIMFASLLPEMIRDCKQVIYDCHKKLHRLMCSSFPMIDIYPTREDETINWPIKTDENGKPYSVYPVDARIAMGDVPKFYRKKIEDFPGFPYIKPTSASMSKWARRLNEMFTDGKPVIAINWIGGHKKTRVEVRSMKLEQWLPILSLDAHFVSLQYTPCEDELREFEAKHGIRIHQLGEAAYNDHYDEVGGVLANVDVVVTCCSSIVHLAGAMGVPCWCLTPSRPAWRYGIGGGPQGDRMPWYGDTVRLFRQAGTSTDWEPVVSEVATRLKERLDAQVIQNAGCDSESPGAAPAGTGRGSDSGEVEYLQTDGLENYQDGGGQ